jgi:hypothetical protein
MYTDYINEERKHDNLEVINTDVQLSEHYLCKIYLWSLDEQTQ